jgi:hypothetical protein
LDYWVAVAMNEDFYINDDGSVIVVDYSDVDPGTNLAYEFKFDPTKDWAFSGPIIQESGITLMRDDESGVWYAADSILQKGKSAPPNFAMTDKSPLVAAMRVFVAIKFGLVVDREQLFH